MATDKIQTGIRFRAEMLNKITFIARKNHRSTTAQVEFLVDSCIKEYEKENGKIDLTQFEE